MKTIKIMAIQPNVIIISASSWEFSTFIGTTTARRLITNVANERPIGLTANGSQVIDA